MTDKHERGQSAETTVSWSGEPLLARAVHQLRTTAELMLRNWPVSSRAVISCKHRNHHAAQVDILIMAPGAPGYQRAMQIPRYPWAGFPEDIFRLWLHGDVRVSLGNEFSPPEPVVTENNTHVIRAVGNRVTFQKKPETYHEFLIKHFLRSLGPDWHKTQLGLPAAQRHALFAWWEGWCRLTKDADGTPRGTVPSGFAKELLVIADDFYLLDRIAALPDNLLARVRHHDQFQGVRFELTIAANFARCGFDVAWHTDKRKPGPEFIATHTHTGERYAVEVKSKHRNGSLNKPGVFTNPIDIDNISRLVNEAIGQGINGIPLIIFIDLNLPLEGYPPGVFEDFHSAAARVLAKVRDPNYTMLFLINAGWHYAGDSSISGKTLFFTHSPNPATLKANGDALQAFIWALRAYGQIPETDLDSDL